MEDFSGGRVGSKHVGDFVEELGFAATASRGAFRAVLSLLPRFDESDLAHLLSALVRTHTRPDDGSPGYAALQASTASLPPVPQDGTLSGWNAEVVTDVLAERRPPLQWPLALTRLDQPGFLVPDAPSFGLLCTLFSLATKEPLPLSLLVGGVWQNTQGQLSLLLHAVVAPPELISWQAAPRRLSLPEGFPTTKPAAQLLANGAWLCTDLHAALARLAEVDGLVAVRPILEAPAAACPEVLLLGAASTRTSWGLLQGELFAALLPGALGLPGTASIPSGSPSASPSLVQRLWATPSGHDAVLRCLVEAHTVQPGCLGRVLDICQDLKALTAVLDSTPAGFAVDLAALAARREYLNLEKWCGDMVAARGRPFVADCLRFLRVKAAGQVDAAHPQGTGINLSVEIAALFFRALFVAAHTFPADLGDELRAVYAASCAANSRLAALSAVDAPRGAPGGSAPAPESFTPDVEEEANAVFQKIYTGAQSIGSVVDMLVTFSQRGGRRERDVFSCMVHNLFDEYRFFPKYPDKELRITALLFGTLIARRLVQGAPLGVALRYVLDELRKQPGTKMFAFGVDAADQFRLRFSEWPQFCGAALQIPHLASAAPELYAALERAVMGGGAAAGGTDSGEGAAFSSASAGPTMDAGVDEASSGSSMARVSSMPMPGYALPDGVGVDRTPSGAPIGSAAPMLSRIASAGSASAPRLEAGATPFTPAPSFASSLNIDTLLNAAENTAGSVPDETTIERVHFACNNLSSANVETKAAEIAARLDRSHWPWLATYLVVKRASLEPNFHALYSALLEHMSQRELTAAVVACTVSNIRVLLRGDKIKTASGERSLLKNLGSWLGLLTVGQGKPLLARQLELKSLLLDAYSRGSMIAVIPFVAKVLEPCRGSRIFAPPNPWTVAILGLLAEIYAHPDLKLNLKFEVERLFKHLGVALSDVPHPGILATRPQPGASSADFVGAKNAPAAGLGMPLSSGSATGMDYLAAGNSSSASLSGMDGGAALAGVDLGVQPGWQYSAPGDASIVSQLTGSLVFSPGVAVLVDRLALKRLLPLALERAIREVVTPVVERSVTIACMTTRELVLKDFAQEPDETALRRAAHLMVASLAGSLALVTCKEPLRVSATAGLRTLLASHLGTSAPDLEPAMLDQAVAVACGDNLDLGCALIEAAAQDKARHDVDEALAVAYAQRKQHREGTAPGTPFSDPVVVSNRRIQLPDSLRPRTLRDRPGLMRVYEDFALAFRGSGTAVMERAAATAAAGTGLVSPRLGMPHFGQAAGDHVGDLGASHGHRALGMPGSGDGLMQGPGVGREFDLQGTAVVSAALGLGGGATFLEGIAALVAKQAAVTERLHGALSRLDGVLAGTTHEGPSQEDLRMALSAIADALSAEPGRDEAASAVALAALQRLVEPGASTGVETAALALLEIGACASRMAVAESVLRVFAYVDADVDARLCGSALDRLVRCGVLDPQDMDVALSKALGSARTLNALKVTQAVVTATMLQPDSVVQPQQMRRCLDKLSALAESRQLPGPEVMATQRLLDAVREVIQHGGGAGRGGPMLVPGGLAPPQPADPPSPADVALREAVASHLDEWARVCDAPAGDALYTSFFSGLATSGLVAGDDAQARTFRTLTELVAAHCLGSLDAQQGPAVALNFAAVDAYARLVLVFARSYVDGPPAAVLLRALNALVAVMHRDQDERGLAFNARPYFRLLVWWLTDLAAPDSALDLSTPAVTAAFAQTLLAVQPLRCPGFAFAWLELVCHRALLPRLAAGGPGEVPPGWPVLARLLTGCLSFLEPRLRAAELGDAARTLYRGLLRVLLLLLHDVPEFLCDYAPLLCGAIPPSCVQMRNLVLSAFPRTMRLPDPFQLGLKVDLLAESGVLPRLAPDWDAPLRDMAGGQLLGQLNAFLATRQPASLPTELRGTVLLSPGEAAVAGSRYNVPMLNALVLHCGQVAIAATGGRSTPDVGGTPAAEVFGRLATELDHEGRYLLFNALANQLRYPNAHTHYFSCMLLLLFGDAASEVVREQITRVLLERLIVNRPHPWGLLITFIELIKNPRLEFWSHSFTRSTPEIERLFESVSRSCAAPVSATA